MKTRSTWFLPCLCLWLGAAFPLGATSDLEVSAGLDARPWGALLTKYVDDHGLVDYRAWKASAADLATLDAYLAALGGPPAPAAAGDEAIATLINAYNALTIRWILQHYPTESIRALPESWSKARWTLGGRSVSLDDIEHKALRPLYGWKVHATIVCAARSCPPLQREAYTAGNLARLTEQAFRAWLGREDLNRFDPAQGTVAVSPIFTWFKEDFTGAGELPRVLAAYAPPGQREFLARGAFRVVYADYDWGLNDAAGRGVNYRPGLLQRLF
jgi:hypothetical protein